MRQGVVEQVDGRELAVEVVVIGSVVVTIKNIKSSVYLLNYSKMDGEFSFFIVSSTVSSV